MSGYGRDDYNSNQGGYGGRGGGGYNDDRSQQSRQEGRGEQYGRNDGGYNNQQGGDYGRNDGGYNNNQGGGQFQDQSDNGRPAYSEGGRLGQGHGNSTGTAYGDGGSGYSNDFSGAAQHAQQNAGDSGDDSLFSQVLSRLSGQQSKLQDEDVDEQQAVKSHQNIYGSGQTSGPVSSGSLGTAAAMQALKLFNQGGSSTTGGQSQFIGLAMAEASKLFDQQSAQGNANGTKQDAVSSAAQMALKMFIKSQMGGGAASGGGAGNLLSMASKFFA